MHRLLPPTPDDLAACHDKVLRLYSTAYGWPAPPLLLGERTSSRTMRQYIKGWITQWDLRRLGGSDVSLISSDYSESTAVSEPSASDEEEA